MLNVFSAAARHPAAIAVCVGSVQLSYGELARRVAQAAARLATLGLLSRERGPIALVARPTLPSLVCLHALLAYDVPILLLHPRLPSETQRQLAERAGASTLLAPDEAPLEACLDSPPPLPVRYDLEAPLALVPTSGSTGDPKLVLLSRRAFLASAAASARNLSLGSADRWLLCLPLSHVGGFSIVTRCLLSGAGVVLHAPGPTGLLGELAALGEAVERHQASLLSLVPAVLDAWLADPALHSPSSSLRAVLLGGAATSPALVSRAAAQRVPILVSYGLTEACSQVATTPFGGAPRQRAGQVSCGPPLPSVELRIAAGGRIQLRGPTLCSGYLGASAPFDGEGWFSTEDRGELDERGELYVFGRLNDVIITGGENVDPARVEAALLALPGVRAAAVFGVQDPRFGERVACALVTTADFDELELGVGLRGQLASHEVPRVWTTLPAIPELPNGKRDLSALRALAVSKLRTTPRRGRAD